MFREGLLDKTLRQIKRFIPRPVFSLLAPIYHTLLAYTGALVYGFPSRSMRVIGVTGTKGKSTVVYLTTRVLENAGHQVAAIGSLGFKIKNKEWPNTLKMTMPGRFKLQKFLHEAKKAGCKYVVLEVTSEGLAQKRHLGIKFDCAVFTNLHREHLESHGSFENYRAAKQELFRRTTNIHVINADDPQAEYFGNFKSLHKIFFGVDRGDMRASDICVGGQEAQFTVYGTAYRIKFGGKFNIYNCLAALATGAMYGIDLPSTKAALEGIREIPGRMQYVQKKPFAVVVDYAHTPDSLRNVYETLKGEIQGSLDSMVLTKESDRIGVTMHKRKLLCVVGAAGGGRDGWKRTEFGRLAAEHCDEVIITNEDPYDENPVSIMKEIELGILNYKLRTTNYKLITDRREAIRAALTSAGVGDVVVISGKGSETSIALAGGNKVPWSDADVVRELLVK